MTPTDIEISKLRQNLLAQAQKSKHRLSLIIEGEKKWREDVALRFLSESNNKRIAWIGDHAKHEHQNLKNAKAPHVVGKEFEIVLFDVNENMDVNLFAATTGTLCGGGLFIFLTLPRSNKKQTLFFQRFFNLLHKQDRLSIVQQNVDKFISSASAVETAPPTLSTDDQESAVKAIINVVRGHRKRPLVLLADRGRGKSAALGIAAAQLLQSGVKNILITAPSIASTAVSFKHAGLTLKQETQTDCTHIKHDNAIFQFIAPDELIANLPKVDLVIIDEAAAIPAPLLEKILKNYSRLVFASTIHGYEGSAQGFAVRFFQKLEQHTPDWKKIALNNPIRWACNDPLENFVNQLFLFHADTKALNLQEHIDDEKLVFSQIDSSQLANDENLLGSVYGLLVTAHYKTKPSDLQRILDDDDLNIFIARYQDQLIATALVAREGEFSSHLSHDIHLGRRRPKGHILAQSLAMHLGDELAACARSWRIVRIAVAPEKQRAGIGGKLINHIKAEAVRQNVDIIGCSFGATPELINFWSQTEFHPVRVGIKKEASSAAHAILMLQGLSKTGEEISSRASQVFQQSFYHLLCDELKHLQTDIVAATSLAIAEKTKKKPDIIEWKMAATFAFANRSYEDNISALHKILVYILQYHDIGSSLRDDDTEILILKVLQKQDWQTISQACNLPGRKQCMKRLKHAFQILIINFSDEETKQMVHTLGQQVRG